MNDESNVSVYVLKSEDAVFLGWSVRACLSCGFVTLFITFLFPFMYPTDGFSRSKCLSICISLKEMNLIQSLQFTYSNGLGG